MKNQHWQRRLDDLNRQHLLREMRIIGSPAGPKADTADGPRQIFCSNDYLGLAGDPRIAGAVASFAPLLGVGSAASRLVSGNAPSHEKLENRYRNWIGTEDAVLFPSGYQANVGALSSLAVAGDWIFSDALVHASIIDGCRLSRASTIIYPHREVTALDRMLSEKKDATGLKLIVTDAVFSMDGDEAPLGDLARIADQHGALLYLDEAHSIGIMGKGGRGLAAREGLQNQVSIHVGTLGKALGVSGALVACGRSAAGILRSRARSLMYTTGPSPLLSEAALKALDIVENGDDLRSRLFQNVRWFKSRAKDAGLRLTASDTPIQPLVIGSSAETMDISNKLWDAGFFVQGIRPPTVEEGSARLRITITAAHTQRAIDDLVSALARCMKPGRTL